MSLLVVLAILGGMLALFVVLCIINIGWSRYSSVEYHWRRPNSVTIRRTEEQKKSVGGKLRKYRVKIEEIDDNRRHLGI